MHPAIQTVSGSRSSGSRSKAKHNQQQQQQQQQQQEVQLQRMIDQQNAVNVDAYSIGTGPSLILRWITYLYFTSNING
jgi:hypothetical protein